VGAEHGVCFAGIVCICRFYFVDVRNSKLC
jgi:hypothetical protein